jgi:hypothetical protein
MKRKGWIKGAYVPKRLEMLQSQAWRTIANVPAAKLVLERIEIEFMRHAGKNNGQIICTYNDFEKYGVRRKSIAPAIRLLVTVGLLVIERRGRRSADGGNPTLYRLPYISVDGIADATDEWRNYRPNKPRHQLADFDVSAPRKSRQKARKIQKLGSPSAPETVAPAPLTSVAPAPLQEPPSLGSSSAPTIYNLPIYVDEQGEAGAGDANADAACAGCRPAEIDWPAAAAASLHIPRFLLRGHPDCVLGDS